MGYFSDLDAEQKEFEPCEQEMRSMHLHHTINSVMDEINATPDEWLDFGLLGVLRATLDKRLNERNLG